MSSKNTLQEFCQKSKLPMPEYNTVRKSLETEPPYFESVVIFNGHTYSGVGSTKIMAEKNVAEKICHDTGIGTTPVETANMKMEQKFHSLTEINAEKYENVFLVDGDNTHVIDTKIFGDDKNLIIYFIAKNTTKQIPLIHQQQYANCCIFISESIERDAVDHFLTFNLGKISVMWKNKKYFVVTKDHFGGCLEKIVENCKLICSL